MFLTYIWWWKETTTWLISVCLLQMISLISIVCTVGQNACSALAVVCIRPRISESIRPRKREKTTIRYRFVRLNRFHSWELKGFHLSENDQRIFMEICTVAYSAVNIRQSSFTIPVYPVPQFLGQFEHKGQIHVDEIQKVIASLLRFWLIDSHGVDVNCRIEITQDMAKRSWHMPLNIGSKPMAPKVRQNSNLWAERCPHGEDGDVFLFTRD